MQPGTETDVAVVPTITTTTNDGLTYQPEQRKCYKCEEVWRQYHKNHNPGCKYTHWPTVFNHDIQINLLFLPYFNGSAGNNCNSTVPNNFIQSSARLIRASVTPARTACWREHLKRFLRKSTATLNSTLVTSWVSVILREGILEENTLSFGQSINWGDPLPKIYIF